MVSLATLGLLIAGASPAHGQDDQDAPPPAPPITGPASELTQPPARPNQLIVIDAAPFGIDPIVGRYVTAQLRETGAAMGYQVVDPEKTVAAARSLSMAYPPAPADLWRVAWASGSERAAFARVWAERGRYIVEVIVASLDGGGPYYARTEALSTDLLETVDRLLREALPATLEWDADAAERVRNPPSRPTSPSPTLRASLVRPPTAEELRAERVPDKRWDLALRSEVAVGTSSDRFNNLLLGARVDFRITHEFLIGAYVGYANLRGRGERASNLLFYALVEDRIYITDESRISIPLRFVFGFLPYNGPYIQLAAGMNFPLTDFLELGIDVLAPTFWILPERRAFSMNFAAELIFRF